MRCKHLLRTGKLLGRLYLVLFATILVACSANQTETPLQGILGTLEARIFSNIDPQISMVTPVPPNLETPIALRDYSFTTHTASPPVETPVPTPTPGPSVTPSPIPTSSSDLLFISQNKLMRWDHITQYASLLVDRVVDYYAVIDPFAAYRQPITPDMALKNYPRLVALLRNQENSTNNPAVFDLELLNLETKQIITLLEGIPKVESIQLTLQGDRLVYIERGVDDRIFITAANQDSQPQVVASCQKNANLTCQKALWSPDGRALVWSDYEGIWLSSQPNFAVRKIHPNLIKILDPRKQESLVKVAFEIISWSPDNRFLLVKIIPSAQGVQWFSVLDTRQSRLVDIPETADFSTPTSKITWLVDGNLLIALSGNLQAEQSPSLQIWKIVPTTNAVLQAGARLSLDQNAGFDLNSLFSQSAICPRWMEQFGPNSFRLGLIDPQGNNSAALVHLDFEKNVLVQEINLPGKIDEILWAPDGSGALVFGDQNRMLFASLWTHELIDLLGSVGQDAHTFSWLAAAPR